MKTWQQQQVSLTPELPTTKFPTWRRLKTGHCIVDPITADSSGKESRYFANICSGLQSCRQCWLCWGIQTSRWSTFPQSPGHDDYSTVLCGVTCPFPYPYIRWAMLWFVTLFTRSEAATCWPKTKIFFKILVLWRSAWCWMACGSQSQFLLICMVQLNIRTTWDGSYSLKRSI